MKSRRELILALGAVPILAACGGEAAAPAKAEPTKAPAAAAPTTAAAAPTKAPEPTKAPAAAAPTAAPAKVLKVGLVTDVGKVDDKSFNESAWNGAKKGAADVKGESKYVETQNPNDYKKNIQQFISEKYDIIVTVGFLLGEATIEAAKANPGIKFIGVDQFQEKAVENLAGLIFEEDKAGYMVGALAALYSKAGKVGAVLATDVVPPVWRFGEGFRAGAKAAKPGVDIQIVYHSDVGPEKTFDDPEWGKATALSMIDKGVDVIFGAGGKTGNGALYGVADRKDKGVVAIGVDTDQWNTVPEAKAVLLSSGMKIIDQGVADIIKAVSENKFKGGNVLGKVGLAPFHDLDSKVDAAVKTKLEEIRKGLDGGTIKTDVKPAKG
ncbi:MAG: BMP family ABC transporter substrate-binding protein [Chloroflexi bacterium]|jgi:basic membrane protein A|nr:BMP family ABC transporter substrate-binding protein [Chloroflexota bacterium]